MVVTQQQIRCDEMIDAITKKYEHIKYDDNNPDPLVVISTRTAIPIKTVEEILIESGKISILVVDAEKFVNDTIRILNEQKKAFYALDEHDNLYIICKYTIFIKQLAMCL